MALVSNFISYIFAIRATKVVLFYMLRKKKLIINDEWLVVSGEWLVVN
jgi:hypothetical protein